MKYIEDYSLLENWKIVSREEWTKRILGFLDHYYTIFDTNKNEWLSNKTLQFVKTGKQFKLEVNLITILLNLEFKRDKSRYKLRFYPIKAVAADALYYHEEHKRFNNKRSKNMFDDKLKSDPEWHEERKAKARSFEYLRRMNDPEWWDKRKEQIKDYGVTKRKEDPAWNKRQLKKSRIYTKKKRIEDPEWNDEINKRRRDKYDNIKKNSPEEYEEKLKKMKDWEKNKKKNDPEWAAKRKESQRKRYLKNKK